jgi:hypothetical protein
LAEFAVGAHAGPYRYANQLPPQLEAMITGLKKNKPHWGARKLRELLLRRLPNDIKPPAVSTIHAVLDRNGLVSHQGRARRHAQGTPLSAGAAPNDLWCADFKGEFRLGNGHYCYPLTVTDHASRYLLLCEALDSVREDPAIVPAALPRSIRTGQPPNPVPCILLGQLAADLAWVGWGIGTGLFNHALARSVSGAALISGRALVVNAVDEDAAPFWRRRGFLPSKDDALVLFRSIPDIAASLTAAGPSSR